MDFKGCKCIGQVYIVFSESAEFGIRNKAVFLNPREAVHLQRKTLLSPNNKDSITVQSCNLFKYSEDEKYEVIEEEV